MLSIGDQLVAKNEMKLTKFKLMAVALAFSGNAFGQATSDVVGYETLSIGEGFNVVGLRLHEKPVASGTFEAVTDTSAQDEGADLSAISGAGTFILEIQDGSGVIQEITAASITGDTIAVADLSGVANGVAYTVRPSDTLASVFGLNGEALTAGFFGPAGADQIQLFNGVSFDSFYYDSGSGAWQDVAAPFGAAIDPLTIDLVYVDGIVINGAGDSEIVVSGDLKADTSELTLIPGANFVSSVSPVGQTLLTAYGADAPELAQGFFGPAGADQIQIFNGVSFDSFYYDSGSVAWQDVTAPFGAAIDPATIDLPSGYVINAAAASSVTQGIPAFFAGL